MYESADIDAAVQGGVLSQADADRLRRFTADRRATPPADEEELPVVGGFGDVMAAISMFLVVLGVGTLTRQTGALAMPLLVALTWGLAELLLRKRRMPLAGALVFLLFAACWAMTCLGFATGILPGSPYAGSLKAVAPAVGLACAAGAMLGCYAWWWRFHLPLAYAGAVLAGLNLATHVLRLLIPNANAGFVSVTLLLSGVAVFALAMLWDMSDVYRQTRRAAVAFWLHAMAGFQIAGATFRMIVGVAGEPRGWERLYTYQFGQSGTGTAVVILLVFTAFCLLALAVDRRSILMSSMIFVVPAAGQLLGGPTLADFAHPEFWHGASPPYEASAMLLFGLTLLGLTIRWSAMRAVVLALLPVTIRAQLPRTDLSIVGPRPVD
jgi:hypothetical protein